MKKIPDEKRIIWLAVFLAFITVFSVIASSCGLIVIHDPRETEPTDDTAAFDSESESEEPKPWHIVTDEDNFENAVKYLADLKSIDMNGAVINIVEASEKKSMFSDIYMFYDEETAKRDAMVEEKYNVKINRVKKYTDVILSEMMEAKESYRYYADLVLIPADKVGFLERNRMITDVNQLEGTDFSAPYFDQSAMLSATSGDRTFAIVGEETKLTENCSCIFVNKGLLREMGLVTPYFDVYSGNWTLDRWNEYVKRIMAYYESSPVTSEEGEEQEERYAIGSDFGTMQELITSLFFSTDQKFFENSTEDYPKTSFVTDLTQKYLDVITEMYESGAIMPDDFEDTDALVGFGKGELPFYIGKINDFFSFSMKGLDWGILPYPKAEKEQKDYGGAISSTTCVLVVPAPFKSAKETGYIVQAMNAAHYKATSDAFKSKMFDLFVCDSDTLSMIDLISKRAVYDFAIYCKDIPAIENASTLALFSAFDGSDTLAENVRKNTFSMNQYLKQYFRITPKEEEK